MCDLELTTSTVLREPEYDSRTYRMSEDKIEGFVDGQEALKQAIYKMLATDRYEYPIYSFRYGIAWSELLGEEQDYVRAEMRRMIRESLLQDDQIQEVDGFSFSFAGDVCRCTFEVQSIYGVIDIETEVGV